MTWAKRALGASRWRRRAFHPGRNRLPTLLQLPPRLLPCRSKQTAIGLNNRCLPLSTLRTGLSGSMLERMVALLCIDPAVENTTERLKRHLPRHAVDKIIQKSGFGDLEDVLEDCVGLEMLTRSGPAPASIQLDA